MQKYVSGDYVWTQRLLGRLLPAVAIALAVGLSACGGTEPAPAGEPAQPANAGSEAASQPQPAQAAQPKSGGKAIEATTARAFQKGEQLGPRVLRSMPVGDHRVLKPAGLEVFYPVNAAAEGLEGPVNVRFSLPSKTLKAGKTYTVTFWLRTPMGKPVQLKGDLGDMGQLKAVEAQGAWRQVTRETTLKAQGNAKAPKPWVDIMVPAGQRVELAGMQVREAAK